MGSVRNAGREVKSRRSVQTFEPDIVELLKTALAVWRKGVKTRS